MLTSRIASAGEKRASSPQTADPVVEGDGSATQRLDGLNSIPLGAWLILPASVLFLVGIFAPSVVVNEFGTTHRLSLLDGVQVLWSTDHVFLAVVILLFTILFPPLKLVLTAAVAIPTLPLSQGTRGRLRKMVESLGRWSLLDVLVIAILIVTVKVRGFVSVKATWGICAFALSIALSMLATHFLGAGRSISRPLLLSPVHAPEPLQSRLGSARSAKALTAMALALIVLAIGWLFLATTGTVNQIHVTRKETIVELPRLFGNPSFYVRVRTLQGIQRLDTKSRRPIGNGLVWALEQPVPLASIYEAELFEEGLFSDKLVDRVTINDRREVGQRFQFEFKGGRGWQRPTALITVATGIGLLMFSCRRTRWIPHSTCNLTNP